jgi:glucosyl-3-phosphoglycerate synthase
LVVRPLLELFEPELVPVLQPLSGEYAGRRCVLEQLPFFAGYGVEIGLLIDVAERYGVDRIVQVDLGRRVHRNRDTIALGRTAFEVMHAMFQRFDATGRLKLAGELPSALRQFVRGPEGPEQISTDLVVDERPPISSVLDR